MRHPALLVVCSVVLLVALARCGDDGDKGGSDTSTPPADVIGGDDGSTTTDAALEVTPLDTLADTFDQISAEVAGEVSDTTTPGDGVEPTEVTEVVDPPTTPGGLPYGLPFVLERPDEGEPMTQAEVDAFTKAFTGMLKDVDYFTWVYETCHGVDASTGYDDFCIWWHDVDAVKEGDTVTFMNQSAYGGSHNNQEPTALVLTQAIGGYLMTGDSAMGKVVEQFAKSFTALMKGFMYDDSDPEKYVLSRNFVAFNHSFTLPSGKKKAVDFTDWYFSYEGWNANRYNYPNNPYWGDIWVTTMRSKDDIPFMYRAAAWFPYVVELAQDEYVKEAVAEALEYMEGFAKDVVDTGYYIKTKDELGQMYIPVEDLASFNDYLTLFPDAECDPRLSSALMAYGEPLDNECGTGQGSDYDTFAGAINYFNYSIFDTYHLSALALALTKGYPEVAKALLEGWIARMERYQDPTSQEPGMTDDRWERDVALLLLKGATLGMPLTSNEARKIQAFHLAAVEQFAEFPTWDLWDESVPDGVYDFRKGFHPEHLPTAIRVEDVAFILEYCWSPFKNPAGVTFVDCSVVADPSKWGE